MRADSQPLPQFKVRPLQGGLIATVFALFTIPLFLRTFEFLATLWIWRDEVFRDLRTGEVPPSYFVGPAILALMLLVSISNAMWFAFGYEEVISDSKEFRIQLGILGFRFGSPIVVQKAEIQAIDFEFRNVNRRGITSTFCYLSFRRIPGPLVTRLALSDDVAKQLVAFVESERKK